jgi:hypothetical protein
MPYTPRLQRFLCMSLDHIEHSSVHFSCTRVHKCNRLLHHYPVPKLNLYGKVYPSYSHPRVSNGSRRIRYTQTRSLPNNTLVSTCIGPTDQIQDQWLLYLLDTTHTQTLLLETCMFPPDTPCMPLHLLRLYIRPYTYILLHELYHTGRSNIDRHLLSPHTLAVAVYL